MFRPLIPIESVTLEIAIQLHNTAKTAKSLIPHFINNAGERFYIDRRGKSSGGGQYFRNLGSKLSAGAARRATQLGQTPTRELFIKAFGEKHGTELFLKEQEDLKRIYSTYDSDIYDIDHIDSLSKGGVHHSRNLRQQIKGENRADGARDLPDELRNLLLLPKDPLDFLSVQGPLPTPELRDRLIKDAFSANNGSMKLNINAIMTRANMPALGGFNEGSNLNLPNHTGVSIPPQLEALKGFPDSTEVPPQVFVTPNTPKEDLSIPVMSSSSSLNPVRSALNPVISSLNPAMASLEMIPVMASSLENEDNKDILQQVNQTINVASKGYQLLKLGKGLGLQLINGAFGLRMPNMP